VKKKSKTQTLDKAELQALFNQIEINTRVQKGDRTGTVTGKFITTGGLPQLWVVWEGLDTPMPELVNGVKAISRGLNAEANNPCLDKCTDKISRELNSTVSIDSTEEFSTWRTSLESVDCLTASVDLRKQQTELAGLNGCNQSKLTPMHSESCDGITLTSQSTVISETTIQQDVQPTSTQLDSPAPEPVTQEPEQVCNTKNQNFGLKPFAASVKDNQGSSLWNSLKGLSIQDYEQCLGDSEWQAIRGKIQSSYRQHGSVLHSAGIEFSLLPTPTTYPNGSKPENRPAGTNRFEQSLNLFISKGDKLHPATAGWVMGFQAGYVEKVLLDGGQVISHPKPAEYLDTLPNAEKQSTSTGDQSVQSKQQSRSDESSTCISCPNCQQQLKFVDSKADCKCFQWFTTIPWKDQLNWGDEPLDPDDVWHVGEKVYLKRKGREGVVVGVTQEEILGGKLNYVVVRWNGVETDALIKPEKLWRIRANEAQPQSEFNPLENTEQVKQPSNDPPAELLLDVTQPEINPLEKGSKGERGQGEKKRRGARGKQHQSGSLYPYLSDRKLKNGIIASYPRVEGQRDPNNPDHWYWAYSFEEKVGDNWRNRSLPVPKFRVATLRQMIADGMSVEAIKALIKGEFSND
jgi:hypothetical protein